MCVENEPFPSPFQEFKFSSGARSATTAGASAPPEARRTSGATYHDERYVTANLFAYNFNDESNYGGLKVPGTGIRLEAVHGLDGTGDLYAFKLANAAMVVDIEVEEQNYKLWYSQDNNDVRFRAAFKMGVNVAFTTECVKFKSTI